MGCIISEFGQGLKDDDLMMAIISLSLAAPFETYGAVCCKYPSQILWGTIAFLSCLFTVDRTQVDSLWYMPISHDQVPQENTFLVNLLLRVIALTNVYIQLKSTALGQQRTVLGLVLSSLAFSSALLLAMTRLVPQVASVKLWHLVPYVLLLLDVSRIQSLHKRTSIMPNSASLPSVLADLGPVYTLDTLVLCLVVGFGTRVELCGQVFMLCLITVMTRYLSLMLLCPPVIVLAKQLFREDMISSTGTMNLSECGGAEFIKKQLNQRAKLVMSLALVLVHCGKVYSADYSGIMDLSSQSEAPEYTTSSHHVSSVGSWHNWYLDIAFTFPSLITLLYRYTFPPAPECVSEPVTPECVSEPVSLVHQWVHEAAEQLERSDSAGTLVQEEMCTLVGELKTAVMEMKITDAVEAVSVQLDVAPTDKFSQSRAQDVAVHPEPCVATDHKLLDCLGLSQTCGSTQLCSMDYGDLLKQFADSSKWRQEKETDVRFDVGSSGNSDDEEESKEDRRPQCDKKISHVDLTRDSVGMRSIDVCRRLCKDDMKKIQDLTDEEIVGIFGNKEAADELGLKLYRLESLFKAREERAVQIRRKIIGSKLMDSQALEDLPYSSYPYHMVYGACCENVIGYLTMPIGVAGPLLLDGKHYYVPMATTEGCLVASTNRGCQALTRSGGVLSEVLQDHMTRAPVVQVPRVTDAVAVKRWCDSNWDLIRTTFNGTSRYARLDQLDVSVAGCMLHLRMAAKTGDAMGMNMVSKGSEQVLRLLREHFPALRVLSISGNMCTDKKSSATNWTRGRGKSVVCDAVIPSQVLKEYFKTSATELVNLNVSKNLIGSALAGCIGGNNAHAANNVAAIFLATGQDTAQVVDSSMCLIDMSLRDDHDLYVSCTMPCVEVGTVGGGTILPCQAACLKMLGVQGSQPGAVGENAQRLARIVCATVLAGELSLMAALTTGDLVRSHMTYNRSQISLVNSIDS